MSGEGEEREKRAKERVLNTIQKKNNAVKRKSFWGASVYTFAGSWY